MPWKVDPANSEIAFHVQHLRLTKVRGRFHTFEGTLDMNEEDPPASAVEGTVDTASLKTGIGPRDSNLRGPGRFDVKRFPKMSFKSTKVGPFDGNRFKVHGNLTIKDITKPVVFDVIDKGELSPVQGQPARRRRAFEATIQLNRKDFGIKWNPLMELGGLFVGDEIDGKLQMTMVKE
jgi:polyisoprenoid-binding protein YceI